MNTFQNIKEEFEKNTKIFKKRIKVFKKRFNKFKQLNSEINKLIINLKINSKQIILVEEQDKLKTQENIKKHLEKQKKYSSCKEFSLLNQRVKE